MRTRPDGVSTSTRRSCGCDESWETSLTSPNAIFALRNRFVSVGMASVSNVARIFASSACLLTQRSSLLGMRDPPPIPPAPTQHRKTSATALILYRDYDRAAVTRRIGAVGCDARMIMPMRGGARMP